jgi:hypothetical protein
MKARFLTLAALLLTGCDGGAPAAPTRQPTIQRAPPTAPPPPVQPTAPTAPRSPTAPVPPGAPVDWLAQFGSRRSRLNSFQPFDVTFDYPDGATREIMQRRVTVAHLRIDTLGGAVRPGIVYISGWCHLRMAARTFRGDLVRDLHCCETGEAPADVRTWILKRARGN